MLKSGERDGIMTSRKFARLAAGAAGGADIGLWIVETVLSCCKRHIPRALRGGHRTKESNCHNDRNKKGVVPMQHLQFGTYHSKEVVS